MLAGWLPDPRLSSGGAGLNGTGQLAAHAGDEPLDSDMSTLWTTQEPLPAPLTDQQVSL